mgnify:CR=1 FL=1
MILVLLLIVHVVVALAICGLVLLQHGKGADMGAAFGSGSSGSLFGASGSANFLSRTTGIMAALFFLTSFGLTWHSTQRPHGSGSVMDTHKVPAPAAPVAPPASGGNAPATTPAPTDAPANSKAGEIPK